MATASRMLAAVFAAIAVAGLPAAAAPRADDPYACGICLFAIRTDGSGFRIVADDQRGYGGAYDLSPDRAKMLFARGGANVYIGTLGGSDIRLLTDNGRGATFSPDGTKVLFTRTPFVEPGAAEPCSEIWVIGVDGSGLSRVSECGVSPAWAPDSRRLAFIRASSANAESGRLTIGDLAGAGRPIGFWEAERAGTQIVWSPRGDLIAYVAASGPVRARAIGGSAGGRASDPTFELRLVRTDGRLVRVFPQSFSPDWSRDGRRIAFDHASSPYQEVPFSLAPGDDLPLLVAPLEGRARAGYGVCGPPSWSPNGRQIACFAFGSCRGAEATDQLYLVPAGGGRPRQLTCLLPGGQVGGFWWSPDGQEIYFSWEFTDLD